MRADQLSQMLAEAFGKERVFVRTEYHIQVSAGQGKQPHDIWVTKFGQIKWRLSGSRQTGGGGPRKLIDKIGGHRHETTDLANMQAAVELSRSINLAGELASQNNIKSGVFVDAGFKSGRARISVVAILGESVDAIAEPIEAPDINAAELIAVERALNKYPDPSLIIYSDSKSCVVSLSNPRVKWIPRDRNRTADRIANLRGR
jgi:hypothetical protein